jgi:hypothetical protein
MEHIPRSMRAIRQSSNSARFDEGVCVCGRFRVLVPDAVVAA